MYIFSNLLYILYSKCLWYRNQVFYFIWPVFLFSLYLWIACLFGLTWTAGRQYWFMVREPTRHWLSHFHWIAWAPAIKCFFSLWLSLPFLSHISYSVLTLHSSSQIHSCADADSEILRRMHQAGVSGMKGRE